MGGCWRGVESGDTSQGTWGLAGKTFPSKFPGLSPLGPDLPL